MQARELAAHHREPRAGQLAGALEIQVALAERLAQIHMVLGGERQLGGGAPLPHFHVVVFVVAGGHFVHRHVGHAHEKFTDLFLDRLGAGHFLVQFRVQGFQGFRHLGLGGVHVHAGLDQLAHFLGGFLALRLQVLGAHVRLLAPGVEAFEAGQVQVIAPFFQRFTDGVAVLAQRTDIKHGRSPWE